MTSRYIKSILCAGLVAVATSSCTDDLEREPFYEATSASVYNDFANYRSVLAKMYAGFAVTGQQGPAGKPDVGGIDEGASNYVRTYWMLQEVPTDEAVIAWNDPGLQPLNTLSWSSSNDITTAMYYRIFYQITLANEFIRETTEGKLSERGISGANLDMAKAFHAEARFLRALSYYHALDLYGNVPFVTEEDPIGAFFPEQIAREDLFNYVESELLAIEDQLVDPVVGFSGEYYARANKAVAWTLLTKLYLNAESYIGTPMYTEAITYAKKVIDAGYSLEEDYDQLFMINNHLSNEIIFPIAFDGLRTQSYGGTTFLTHAPVGGAMSAAAFGIDSGWGGIRTTPTTYNLFSDEALTEDDRANFFTEGQSLEINSLSTFTDGYPITKWKNVDASGQAGSNPTFVDTDFPMFRLADVYLMYAEAVLRGGAGGSEAQALAYVNELRERAYGDESGNITNSQLNLDFILNERARELNWEGHRRTDLIRFGMFTGGDYLWAWKGGVQAGASVSDIRRLYPLPSNDLTANPNLVQNTGY